MRRRPAHSFSRSSTFANLARTRLGQRAELDAVRDLEGRQPGTDVPAKLVAGGRLPLLQGDPGHRPLAPLVVRHGDDRCLQHRGVAGQRRLDLDGGDVLSPGDDDVLGPVADLEISVRVQDAEVPGAQPAVRYGLRRRVRVAVVAEHEVVAVQRNLAEGGAVARNVTAAWIEDTDPT